jgi:hypothetical protein
MFLFVHAFAPLLVPLVVVGALMLVIFGSLGTRGKIILGVCILGLLAAYVEGQLFGNTTRLKKNTKPK